MFMKVMCMWSMHTCIMFPTGLVQNPHSVKKTNCFGNNKKAYEYFERMQEHLKENGLKLEK